MSQKIPKCVLISDIHFTPQTLDLAFSALTQAINKANELHIPLVIAGDTLDSKAIIRAECANAIINILDFGIEPKNVYILVGNHDLVNEKSSEHALNFLKPYAQVVQCPTWVEEIGVYLMPYTSDPSEILKYLSSAKKDSTIIMHQGVQGAWMGHYVQDRTSLTKEAFADFRVISGHYHRAQDIKCGRVKKGSVGLFTYIGNPYTLSFAEADDGPKGFAILSSDGSLERIPTNLRRHRIFKRTLEEIQTMMERGPSSSFFQDVVGEFNEDDLIWLKITGSNSELKKLTKKELGDRLFGHNNFKLELIPLDAYETERAITLESLGSADMLDSMIGALSEPESFKQYLKSLWKEYV
jgi:DNA repair exonuclease SbcCD nuclease subunit